MARLGACCLRHFIMIGAGAGGGSGCASSLRDIKYHIKLC
jgi:hypothetical protein